MRLDQQHNDIGIRRPAPGRSHHGPIQSASWPKQARRIHEYNLRVAFNCHTPNARARRLNLVGHDRHLRPDHAVQKRRFSCVGLSDKSDKTGTGGHGSYLFWDAAADTPKTPSLPERKNRLAKPQN